MKKIIGSFTAAIFALSMFFTGCQNDSDSNSALLLGLQAQASGGSSTEDLSKNSVVASLYLNSHFMAYGKGCIRIKRKALETHFLSC